MAKRKLPDQYPTNGDFSAAVIELYKWSIGPMDRPFEKAHAREARKCASGLRLIRKLLDDYMQDKPLSASFPGSGVIEAYGILDHLTSGLDHEISMHINGIHSGRYRSNTAGAGEMIILSRAVVTATALAIMESQGIGRESAIKIIVEKFKNRDFAFTAGQVLQWMRNFAKDPRSLDKAIKPEICRRAGLTNRSIIDVGLELIENYWSVDLPWGNVDI